LGHYVSRGRRYPGKSGKNQRFRRPETATARKFQLPDHCNMTIPAFQQHIWNKNQIWYKFSPVIMRFKQKFLSFCMQRQGTGYL
jgi:hypothetical protein